MVTTLLFLLVLGVLSQPGEKFLSQFGELPAPSEEDYEYDKDYVERTSEFLPTLRPRLFSALVHRSYNPRSRKHHYHANQADVALHSEKGFREDGNIGRAIPTFIMKKRPMLHQVCPQLAELFSLLDPSTDSLLLSIDHAEVAARLSQGWRRLSSVGFCVRSAHAGVCGAKRPLMHLVGVGRRGNDNFYTADMEEFERANTQDIQFRGTGKGPLCFLW